MINMHSKLHGYFPGDEEADLAFCLTLDKGEEDWRVFCFTGRIPQSIGASSPHFICVLKPQSSHSSTGFQPNRFKQISHLATSNPLEKNKSSGFQPASAVFIGETFPLPLPILCPFVAVGRFAPGLMRVNR